MGLRKKVFLILILLTIVPLVILGTMSNYFATNILKEKITVLSNKTLENLTVFLSKDIQNYTSLVFYCSRNQDIISCIKSSEVEKAKDNYFLIKKAITKSEVVRQVNYPFHYIVLSQNSDLYTIFEFSETDLYKRTVKKISENKWIKGAIETQVSQLTIHTGENILFSRGARQIYFVSNIIDNFTNLGIVLIGLDEYVFSRFLENSKITPGSGIYILDDTMHLITEGENNPDLLPGEMDSVENHLELLRQEGRYVLTEKRLYFRDSDIFWNVVMVTPLSEIRREVRKISYVYYLLIGICIIAVLFLSFLVNKVIVKPVILLSHLTERVSAGDLEVPKAPENQRDEIGRLGKGFNAMTQNLKEYISSIENQESAKRKLEVKMLQNQINPHFLRNSLNTIRWMAELKHAQGISRAIVSLSKLLDYNLSLGDILVPLEEELEYTKEYIHLQMLRYQNKFVYHCEIPKDFLRYHILKCTFQPIIENSIIHGFKGKRGKCSILLTGKEEGKKLIFSIEDNGVGMPSEVVENLFSNNRNTEKKSGEGIALSNIMQRITLHYGKEYGIEIQSVEKKGTLVTMVIPKIIDQKEPAVHENNDNR